MLLPHVCAHVHYVFMYMEMIQYMYYMYVQVDLPFNITWTCTGCVCTCINTHQSILHPPMYTTRTIEHQYMHYSTLGMHVIYVQ